MGSDKTGLGGRESFPVHGRALGREPASTLHGERGRQGHGTCRLPRKGTAVVRAGGSVNHRVRGVSRLCGSDRKEVEQTSAPRVSPRAGAGEVLLQTALTVVHIAAKTKEEDLFRLT